MADTPVNPNPDRPDASSQNLDPGMAGSARQSPYPDATVYDRPASTRVSAGNLTLSIAVVAIVAVLAVVLIIWLWWRAGGDAAETAGPGVVAVFSAATAFLLPARFR